MALVGDKDTAGSQATYFANERQEIGLPSSVLHGNDADVVWTSKLET